MAERQKALAVAFGGKTITPVKFTNAAGSSTTLSAHIESVEPVKRAEKTEMKDGDGDVNGLIIKNQTTSLSVNFYVSDTTIAAAETANDLAMTPGDKVEFDDTGFAEIDDATNKFIIDEVTKNRTFGEVRKIGLSLTAYANDVSAEATAA